MKIKQKRIHLILSVFSMVLMVVSCADSTDQKNGMEEATPIKALLITGGGWHDYETQKELLTNGISDRIDIEWTVVMEGIGEPEYQVSLLSEDNWADSYDVIVHNIGFGHVEDADYVTHMVEQHQGTPAVLIHAAIMSYRNAEPSLAWSNMMGVKSTWHERRRAFPVENIAPDHPIMQDFPDHWEPPVDDELYVIEEVLGGITPLLQGYGQETEAYHPVAWINEDSGIRVFSTTLGHDNEIFRQSEFLDMVTYGLLWAVDRL